MNTFAVGTYHSIRLDEYGNGYIWGYNYFGQLGIENNNNLTLSCRKVKIFHSKLNSAKF